MKRPSPRLRMAVEEEYQIVDRQSGRLRPDCASVMDSLGSDSIAGAAIQHELHLSQIEMASPICNSLQDVQATLSEVRGRLIEAAKKVDAELIAAGTHPLGNCQTDDVTPKPRYRSMADRYQQLARDLVIFGCHVHIDMPDRELGVQVMNRVTPWLPALQALSANSPFWHGADTGYASYRREMWVQWPMAGPPAFFPDLKAHDDCIAQLVRSEAIVDPTRIYWDVRLPTKTPTIEFRVMDVMSRIDETVVITGLIRALVARVMEDIQRGLPCQPIRPEIVRVSLWQAARFGVSDHLLDPFSAQQVLAHTHIHALLDYVRDPLERYADHLEVCQGVQRIIELGGGAARQRGAFREGGCSEVIRGLIEDTARGTDFAGARHNPTLNAPVQ